MKTLLRWFVTLILGFTVLLMVFLGVVTLFKIPIDLMRFQEPIQNLAANAVGREVVIEESIIITTSMSPVFTLKGLRIGNPKGFENNNFLYLAQSQVQVKLLPLLKRKLHIANFTVEGLDVALEENQNNQVNWLIGQDSGGVESEETREGKKGTGGVRSPQELQEAGLHSDSIVVSNLEFRNISISYTSSQISDPQSYQLDECTGRMEPGEPLTIDFSGAVNGNDYEVLIGISSLEELLTHHQSWMEIHSEIAYTQFNFEGRVNLAEAHQSLTLKSSVTGDDLRSLNDLLQTDLPPFKAYEIAADLHLKEGQFHLENLYLKNGESSLKGMGRIEKKTDVTAAEFVLHAPVIQINDFVFDDWSWGGESEAEGEDSIEETALESSEDTQGQESYQKLSDPDHLKKINLSLSIKAESVRSGNDELGGGELEAKLAGGRLDIERLHIVLPKGRADLVGSFVPGVESSEVNLKLKIENFDFGVWVRRSDPEAKMGGLVNLDTELTSTAATFDTILENGNGYFDFSGQLENIDSGLVDLWAVNLVKSVLTSTEEQESGINCTVGRWSVKNGMLVSDTFFVDTSKIRICARGKVDFNKDRVKLRVNPHAKRAEFFSLATPIKIEGSFKDLKFGVPRGGILLTAVRFVASPVTVPFRRILISDIPADGSDACHVELGPDNRDDISITGCR
ncbi:MAG: AsmA family protein [Desulfobulbaceae bacterium]|nr:MAG: AsmA family protein [Desulfobulbaceae bacterium]